MPTPEHRSGITLEEARDRVRGACFGAGASGPGVGKVGLEPELFPILVAGDGRPRGRVPLLGPGGTLELFDRAAGGTDWLRKRGAGPSYLLATGGRITFEPGGQVEHSTAVHPTAAGVLEEVEWALARVRPLYAAAGAVLATAGLDLWHEVSEVPQQLDHPRYPAMAAYFDRRGPWGRLMMRHTTSMQVNLDLGGGEVSRERWWLANLVSPLVTATFASAPAEGLVSERALVWQHLDPSRAGFPRGIGGESAGDPGEIYADAALDADVMLFWKDPSTAEPGEPGWSFGRWVREGHPRHGWPTAKDLEYHLTTLFFEVRPRGFLELRAVDGLPDRWRPVPVVLLCGLLYDDTARTRGLALLDGLRPRLPEVWSKAARSGVRDGEIGPLAARAWEIALEGARRLPRGFLRAADLAAAGAFLEGCTSRGRMPADDLREAFEEGPGAALRWAELGERGTGRSRPGVDRCG